MNIFTELNFQFSRLLVGGLERLILNSSDMAFSNIIERTYPCLDLTPILEKLSTILLPPSPFFPIEQLSQNARKLDRPAYEISITISRLSNTSSKLYTVSCILHELLAYLGMSVILRNVHSNQLISVQANHFSNPIPHLLAKPSSATFFEITNQALDLQPMHDFEIFSTNVKNNLDYNSVYRSFHNTWQSNPFNLVMK